MSEQTPCPYCSVVGDGPVPAYLEEEPAEGTMRIAIVAEAPGEIEVMRKRPMVGPSGKLIRAVLNYHGYNDKQILFTNVCCCRPARRDDKGLPLRSEVEYARARMIRELEDFKPDRILCCGGTAAAGLLGWVTKAGKTGQKITQIRGVWTESPWLPGIPVLPTTHPAFVLRVPEAYQEFSRDISVLRESTEPFPTPVSILVDTAEQLREVYSLYLKKQGSTDDGIRSIDIETEGFIAKKKKLISIGMAASKEVAIVVSEQALFGPDKQEVFDLLTEMANNPELVWIGHNAFQFDGMFLRLSYGVDFHIQWDTMLMHYCIDERVRTHGLKTLGTNVFGVRDYENEVTQYLDEEWGYRDAPRDVLYKYQAYDATLTWALWHFLRPKMDEGKLLSLHNNVMKPIATMLGEIRQYGVRLDRKYLQELQAEWEIEVNKFKEKLNTIAGMELNPNSPKQLAHYMYDIAKMPQFNLKDVASSSGAHKDTLTSTAGDILEHILPHDKTGFIQTLMSYRRLSKLKSTYVDGLLNRIDDQDQVYPELIVIGTETGRLSARSPNIQNIPKHDYEDRKKQGLLSFADQIRYAFMPRPGYVFVDVDYSQLEYRVAAWYCRDPGLVDAFNSGVDFHKAVASTIYNVPPEKVTKNQRHSAKFVNFGIMYGRQAKALSQSELMWAYSDTEPCTLKQAENFLRTFLDRFPKQEEFMLAIEKQVAENGYVESWYGRRRRFPFIPSHMAKMKFAREARNMPVQGMASDICSLSAVRIHRTFDPEDVKVLFLIHDAIMMEVKEEKVDTLLPQIIEIMEHPDLEEAGFPFKVDPEIMHRWALIERDEDPEPEVEEKTMDEILKEALQGI